MRETNQADWMQGRFPVIVATISFGMGVDKANVRYVFISYCFAKAFTDNLSIHTYLGIQSNLNTCITSNRFGAFFHLCLLNDLKECDLWLYSRLYCIVY